jgi:hypothetical protein
MYSFILVFEGDFEQPWTRVGIPRIVDSTTGWLGADGKPVVYVKSDEGDVYSLSAGEEPRHEKIEGSGVYSEDAEGLGYTNRIVAINETLFVTGYHSQLYRRTGSAWEWFHREKLPRPEAGYEYLIFGDLAGSSQNDIYMNVTYSPASTTRKLTEEECWFPCGTEPVGVRIKSWTVHKIRPRLLRYSTGLSDPSDILMRLSLYHRM